MAPENHALAGGCAVLSNVVVSGLSGSARALFLAGLWQSLRRPLIVVTPQDRGVETLAADIAAEVGDEFVRIPDAERDAAMRALGLERVVGQMRRALERFGDVG